MLQLLHAMFITLTFLPSPRLCMCSSVTESLLFCCWWVLFFCFFLGGGRAKVDQTFVGGGGGGGGGLEDYIAMIFSERKWSLKTSSGLEPVPRYEPSTY